MAVELGRDSADMSLPMSQMFSIIQTRDPCSLSVQSCFINQLM